MQPLYNRQWKPDRQCGKQGKRNQSQILNSFCDYIRHKHHRNVPFVMLNHRKPKQRNSTVLLLPWTTWQETIKQAKAQSQPPQDKRCVCHGSHLSTAFLGSPPAQTNRVGSCAQVPGHNPWPVLCPPLVANMAFSDFSKAFDIVYHGILLDKTPSTQLDSMTLQKTW